MKRIVIATTEDELNENMKDQIAILSDKYNGIISGVIRYPKMFILNETEIMAEAIKKVKADYVFFVGYDCLLSEIKTDCRLSDEMDKIGVKLINTNTANEIREAIDEMPSDIIDFLKGSEEQGNDSIKYDDEDNIMIICNKNTDRKELAIFNDEVAMGDVNIVSNLTLEGFSKNMCSDIDGFIEDLNINHIIVFNDIDSIEFDDYMESLKQRGIEVFRRDRQEYSNMQMASNSGLN